MGFLANKRSRRRNHAYHSGRSYDRARISPLSLFIFLFISLAALVVGKIAPETVSSMRGKVVVSLVPVLDKVAKPFQNLSHWHVWVAQKAGLYDEIASLRSENEALKAWQWRAQRMEHRVIALQKLLNLKDHPTIKRTTGQILSDAYSPFSHSVLLNIGRTSDLKSGYAVTSHDGLIGRLVEVGERGSRVLLLTDFNSRIPVNIGHGDAKAILKGDNSTQPWLDSLAHNAAIYEGDIVYSSGLGGLLPRGLKIGTIEKRNDIWRVKLKAQLHKLDYVSVLFFDAPRLETANSAKQLKKQRRALVIDQSRSAGLK